MKHLTPDHGTEHENVVPRCEPVQNATIEEGMRREQQRSSLGIAVHFQSLEGLFALFRTHPPTAERIARLEEMAGARSNIAA